jgi:uncharacterized protein with HEPN domain
MEERDRVYLVDMFESAQLAVSYLRGVSRETFLQDLQLQDALVRRIEIIGEAARRISSPPVRRLQKCLGRRSLGCVIL